MEKNHMWLAASERQPIGKSKNGLYHVVQHEARDLQAGGACAEASSQVVQSARLPIGSSRCVHSALPPPPDCECLVAHQHPQHPQHTLRTHLVHLLHWLLKLIKPLDDLGGHPNCRWGRQAGGGSREWQF